MRVVAFNGSPRKDGNTARLVRRVFAELEAEGIETELVQLGGEHIHGCVACYNCFTNKDRRCAIADDKANTFIERMLEADGIILGSPTYFADITPETKALIDRAGLVARANGDLFQRKVGAAVVAVRRGGAVHAFDSINHFFLITQMIIPGSIYWNMAIGREKGEVESDEEGQRTMETLGRNMAWLLKKLNT
ncbi:MAG TPA: flavodoxin family protein [Armatimonadota bacterium]|nr:flavodoxin family protein [Armatimonadota bacterium]HQK96357.1 flavodoxin family protein [Armatimonadota bacterium]